MTGAPPPAEPRFGPRATGPTLIGIALNLLAAPWGLMACGSTEVPPLSSSGPGGDDAGRGGRSGADGAAIDLQFDGSVAGFSVVIEEADTVSTTATLTCPGDCLDVTAMAQGGVQPYTYTWSDGTTGPMRHLCPSSTATISVSVTDAGVTGGEFARPPWTTKATLTIQVLSCSQGGPSGPEAGAASDGGRPSESGCGSDSTSPPPSCAPGGPGTTNCGAGGESCCTSLEVTGGTYYRTYANSGSGPTGEADPATVSCFRLDKYEVTVGRFRQFVNAWNGGWLPPAGSGKHTHLNGGRGLVNIGGDAGLAYETGWVTSDDGDVAPTNANLSCDSTGASSATWTPSAGKNENLPIGCVLWAEAYAFCIWDGGFLPSEAEWGYAAAGGSQQREYPWGTAAPGTANQYAIYGCYYPSGSGTCPGGANTSAVNIAPVGTPTLGAGLWGQLDLVGNLWEWNLDWFADYVDPCADCANGTGTRIRAMRGGDYSDPSSYLPSQARNADTLMDRAFGQGLRCARTP